ncbi:MAG TPA: MoaD/ThiS family protein [Kiritimatiellia bacterium]|nr:MoaD/ThiS family protein [Kiritimatiellia bacterium]
MIEVTYFGVLAEIARTRTECVETSATTAGALYDDLADRHRFSWPPDRIRLAVNEAIVNRAHPLRDGDRIMLLPPVSGG